MVEKNDTWGEGGGGGGRKCFYFLIWTYRTGSTKMLI